MQRTVIEVEVDDTFIIGDCGKCPLDKKQHNNISCDYHPDFCPLVFEPKEVSE